MRKSKFKFAGYKPVTDDEVSVLKNLIYRYFPLLTDVECENFIDDDDSFCLVTAKTPKDICGVNILKNKIFFAEGTGMIFKILKAVDDNGNTRFEMDMKNHSGVMMKWPMFENVYVIELLDNYAECADINGLEDSLAREGELFGIITNLNKISKSRTGEIKKEFAMSGKYQPYPKYESEF